MTLYTVNFDTAPPEVYVQADQGIHLSPFKYYSDCKEDPRGILWMWEPPQRSSTYIVSADPTRGIPGWTRDLRMQEDAQVDNAALQVIRVGRHGNPDTQVAEFAAPVSPRDFAKVVNIAGRLYAGNADDGQALVVIEVWPGPGLLTVNEMQHHLGYHNLYVHTYQSRSGSGLSSSVGFTATGNTVRDMWIEGLRHIEQGGLIVNSPALVDEMNDCFIDQSKQRGQALYGAHDDRVSSILMGLWAAHDWTGQLIDTIPTKEVRSKSALPSWQSGDYDVEEMQQGMERRFQEILEGRRVG